MGDHTECFQVDFDPQAVSYEELLELSLDSHDPTRAAYKQQYASLALTHGDAQLATARAVAERFESRLGRRLATRIGPIKRFYPAEDYHQKYYLRNDRVLMADFRAMLGDDQAALRESTAAARVNGFIAGDGARDQLDAVIDLLGLSDEGRIRIASRVRGGSVSGGCSI
jgi:hypothetical protein